MVFLWVELILENAIKVDINPLFNNPGAWLFLHLSTRLLWMAAKCLAEIDINYSISPVTLPEGKLSYLNKPSF